MRALLASLATIAAAQFGGPWALGVPILLVGLASPAKGSDYPPAEARSQGPARVEATKDARPPPPQGGDPMCDDMYATADPSRRRASHQIFARRLQIDDFRRPSSV